MRMAMAVAFLLGLAAPAGAHPEQRTSEADRLYDAAETAFARLATSQAIKQRIIDAQTLIEEAAKTPGLAGAALTAARGLLALTEAEIRILDEEVAGFRPTATDANRAYLAEYWTLVRLTPRDLAAQGRLVGRMIDAVERRDRAVLSSLRAEIGREEAHAGLQ